MASPASEIREEILPPAFRMTLQAAAGAAVDDAALMAEARPLTRLPEHVTTWQEALRSQLERPGLMMRDARLEVREAARAARSGSAFVTRTDRGWIALVDGNERRAKVARPDTPEAWVALEELELEIHGGGEIGLLDWVLLDGGLSAATSSAGQKLPPFRRLLEIVRPERGDIFAIVLYAALIGLLSLAIPIAVQQLVNTVAFGGLVQPVVVLAFLLLMGLTIGASLSAFQAYLAEILQRRVFVRACVDLAHRLPRVAADAFGTEPAAAFVNRYFDIVTLQKTGARLLLEASAVLLQTSTGLLVLSFYHPLMLGLSALLIGAMAAVAFIAGRGAVQSAVRESTAKYDLANWLEELVRHRTAFRTTAGLEHAAARADALISAWVGARRQHYRRVFRQLVSALALQAFVNTLLLALGGFLVVSGELTLGQLVASEIIVAAVVASFSRLAKHFESYYDLLAAVDKVGGLLDLPQQRSDSSAAPLPGERPMALKAHDLHVKGAGNRSVLQDVSLEIRPGERLALMGGPASGKSTLLDVLAGVRTPDSGYVALDDEDLRELAPQVARDRIMPIHEPQLLPATVLENLTLARSGVTKREAQDALARVGLLSEIREFPDGIDTHLQTGGAPLSRSQAARLEIARAILARPSVLLLDEVLMNVGNDAMKPVLDVLFEPDAPWTLVVVSGKPRVLERCDRVLCIDGGRLVPVGAGVSSDLGVTR